MIAAETTQLEQAQQQSSQPAQPLTAEALPPEPKQLGHRYEGRLKVTGKAKYAAEFKTGNPAYAYMVQSTIPNGTITTIDTMAASKVPGVLQILTPFNAVKLPGTKPQPPARRHVTLLQDTKVSYNGQPIAVVVADTLDQARYAASLLKVSYQQQPATLHFQQHLADARKPRQQSKEPYDQTRGDMAAASAKASVTVEQTYTTPMQYHNPMEPHGTIASWDGDKLHLYDSTQYISGVKQTVARELGIAMDDIQVECPYTGGGFGSKGSAWSHVMLAAMAARATNRPVKLVVDRDQMFGPVGGRPRTVQKIKLAATADGKLTGVQHDVIIHTSVMEDFLEPSAFATRLMYQSEANVTTHRMVDQNLGVATFQRAPGEATGTAALEIAMDELAEKLNMDPVQLRLVNYAEKDPGHDRPFSEKSLRQCYSQAAERFGWSKRSAKPGQMQEGDLLIGYGMATATYPANRSAAMAAVKIMPNGHALVSSGTQDLGTGTYTIMAQTCADALGLDPKLVEVKLGDSTLPKAPVSGGSQSAASVMPAIQDAAMQAKLKLSEIATADSRSPLFGLKTVDLVTKDGCLCAKDDPSKQETFAAILVRNGNQTVEASGSAQPGEDKDAMTTQSFGAVFAEVAVDRYTHMPKVRRVVATYDIGTLINNKTGLNQLVGGIVWGVGIALHEDGVVDNTYGRIANHNLAEYHVPVNADIGTVDVTVTGIPDTKFNPLGARGIGEIGITGAAAAVANAIYNATGKRIREYPITVDKIMSA